ncbi:autotransporter outer membrane beta-barrel domain-containing protein [Ostreibacterium oceani]|nr:autotransporter outer membrane beta-barrel domain-containing protein [Ostreibacterium oceani]
MRQQIARQQMTLREKALREKASNQRANPKTQPAAPVCSDNSQGSSQRSRQSNSRYDRHWIAKLVTILVTLCFMGFSKAQLTVVVTPGTLFGVFGTTTVSASTFINDGTTGLFDTSTLAIVGVPPTPVINNSLLTLSDDATDDTPTIIGDFENNGTVRLDINTGTHESDLLTIDGNVTAPLVIYLNNLDPANSDIMNIPLIRVTGDANSASLSDGTTTYIAAGVTYQLRLIADTWTLVPRIGPPAPIPANHFLSLLLLIGLMILVSRRTQQQRQRQRPR